MNSTKLFSPEAKLLKAVDVVSFVCGQINYVTFLNRSANSSSTSSSWWSANSWSNPYLRSLINVNLGAVVYLIGKPFISK
jgi:hypothetical protein